MPLVCGADLLARKVSSAKDVMETKVLQSTASSTIYTAFIQHPKLKVNHTATQCNVSTQLLTFSTLKNLGANVVRWPASPNLYIRAEKKEG